MMALTKNEIKKQVYSLMPKGSKFKDVKILSPKLDFRKVESWLYILSLVKKPTNEKSAAVIFGNANRGYLIAKEASKLALGRNLHFFYNDGYYEKWDSINPDELMLSPGWIIYLGFHAQKLRFEKGDNYNLLKDGLLQLDENPPLE